MNLYARLEKTITVVALVAALFAATAVAEAQGREGRWEFTLGTLYQLGIGVDGEGGGTLDTDDAFGLAFGGGYNFSDRLATTFGMQWAGVDYDTTGFNENGDEFGISGAYDAWTLSANLVYHFTDGQLTPYVGAGIGWTSIDTNVPDGPGETWCWWDPWWGYVCSTTYPTKTTDAFTYQATLGLRYTFDNDSTFLRAGYTSQWMDFDRSSSTPRFDVIMLDFGWIF